MLYRILWCSILLVPSRSQTRIEFLVAPQLAKISNKVHFFVSKILNQFMGEIPSHMQGKPSISSTDNLYAADTNAAAVNNITNDRYSCTIPHCVKWRELISHQHLGCPEKYFGYLREEVVAPHQKGHT